MEMLIGVNANDVRATDTCMYPDEIGLPYFRNENELLEDIAAKRQSFITVDGENAEWRLDCERNAVIRNQKDVFDRLGETAFYAKHSRDMTYYLVVKIA